MKSLQLWPTYTTVLTSNQVGVCVWWHRKPVRFWRTWTCPLCPRWDKWRTRHGTSPVNPWLMSFSDRDQKRWWPSRGTSSVSVNADSSAGLALWRKQETHIYCHPGNLSFSTLLQWVEERVTKTTPFSPKRVCSFLQMKSPCEIFFFHSLKVSSHNSPTVFNGSFPTLQKQRLFTTSVYHRPSASVFNLR